mmetsp:Transcript_16234/g.35234  ORF Transcript_16234/g.35234 Transcript_16234/m.35234 type:complete len:565 (+) Transcript_16234:26-1720(+)
MTRYLAPNLAAVTLLLLLSIGQISGAGRDVASRRRVRTQAIDTDAKVKDKGSAKDVPLQPDTGAAKVRLEDKAGGIRSSTQVTKPVKVKGGGSGGDVSAENKQVKTDRNDEKSHNDADTARNSPSKISKINPPGARSTSPQSTITQFNSKSSVRGGPLARILGMFGMSTSSEQSRISPATKRRGNFRRFKRRKQSQEEMLYSDITLAFINGLKSGLYDDAEKPLSNERKQILLDWLDLLSATLPPEFGLHLIIDTLRTNWIDISSSRNKLMSVLSVALPANKEYSDECTKESKKFLSISGRTSVTAARGSTCAAWRLFHVVSVGLAERMGGTDASRDDEMLRDVDAALGVVGGKHRRRHRAFSPKEAADILRNTIDAFLTCEVCRKDFIEQYDRCDYGRCDRLTDSTENLSDFDWREFSMYLWEYHNGVSTSIARKLAKGSRVSETRATISQLWPSVNDCLACQAEDGSWNKQRVYEYLRKTYWGEFSNGSAAENSAMHASHKGSGLHLDSTSALRMLGAMSVAILILSSIKIWSSWFLWRQNLVGYLPSSADHFTGKSIRKKE